MDIVAGRRSGRDTIDDNGLRRCESHNQFVDKPLFSVQNNDPMAVKSRESRFSAGRVALDRVNRRRCEPWHRLLNSEGMPCIGVLYNKLNLSSTSSSKKFDLKLTRSNRHQFKNRNYQRLLSVISSILLFLCLTNSCYAAPNSTTDLPLPASDSRTTITVLIGVILPHQGGDPLGQRWTVQKVAPAIQLAIARLPELDLLSSVPCPKGSPSTCDHASVVIEPVYADSKCSETFGPLAAFNMVMYRRPHVFFGPACDYALAPIARFSPHWNIPVLTAAAQALAFSDKKQYELLTRMLGVHTKLGDFIVELYDHFGWTVSGLLFNQRSVMNSNAGMTEYFFIMEGVHTQVLGKLKKADPYASIYLRRLEDVSYNYTKLLEDASTNCRIIVLCASTDSVRDIMLTARRLGFNNGEYVFLNIDLFSSKKVIEKPWYRVDDPKNDEARQAYESLLTITLRKPDSAEYRNFSTEVKKRAKEEYGDGVYGEEEVNSFVGAFHDAVILYAIALNETLTENGNITDGQEITRRMWNRTFEGITGTVSIDENGDRNADYSLLFMNKTTGKFEVAANYYGNEKVFHLVVPNDVLWKDGVPPPDVPKCGFDNTKCADTDSFPIYAIIIIALGVALVVVVIIALYVTLIAPKEIPDEKWKVKWEDIDFGNAVRNNTSTGETLLGGRRPSISSVQSVDTMANNLTQVFTRTGNLNSTMVAIKEVRQFTPTSSLKREFVKLKDMHSDHIARFIGLCVDPGHHCILTEYCKKGSLQDVLENEEILLDKMFKFNILQDIIRGMLYIHNTDVRSHGTLKSSNCVVDSRFAVKLTDFGLHAIRDKPDFCVEEPHAYYQGKLWTAPELLRDSHASPKGTPKGDVYSFAIICQEVVYRHGVFWNKDEDLSPQEIYERVKSISPIPYRPTLIFDRTDDFYNEDFFELIRQCWSENPEDRQDFSQIKSRIKRLNKDGDCGNLVDNLISRMEYYANHLESLVKERTAKYLEEKKRAEDLLYMMLPRSVAEQLMVGQEVPAVKYENVTIYFSDICGFTALSAESTPMQVVDLLNDLYTTFDQILEKFDVYKVETIGDAYMVVSGLPVENGDLHSREICRMALHLLNAVKSFRIRHRPGQQLNLRIGIHSGPVCAGIVGRKMPRYCLFGDTVNTASRMESNGLPLKIHISPETKVLLDRFQTFQLEFRGPVEMKGKGTVETWWLQGENTPEEPDLASPFEQHTECNGGAKLLKIDC